MALFFLCQSELSSLVLRRAGNLQTCIDIRFQVSASSTRYIGLIGLIRPMGSV
jgi:hypothetical protein